MDRVTPRTKNRSMDKSPSRKCNRYQARERPWPTCATNTLAINRERAPARPLARLGSSRITAKRFRRIIIESVSVFSNLLPLTHLRRKIATDRAVPHQLQHVIACSALRRERTPRPRSQRRQGQPWPGPQACATAARKECPAQSRGNRTSGPHL